MIQISKKSFLAVSIFVFLLGLIFYLLNSPLTMSLKAQPEIAPDFKVSLLSGGEFNLQNLSNKKIIVFWATWCGHCSLELGRLNRLIKNKEIPQDGVLAISVAEEINVVQDAIQKRSYLFDVAVDTDGKIAKLFKVPGTPAMFFIDENRRIIEMTTGITSSLDIDAKNFLK